MKNLIFTCTDAVTGQALPECFINNNNDAAIANDEGVAQLTVYTPENYLIVARLLGYEDSMQDFSELYNDQGSSIEIELPMIPKTFEQSEVQIVGNKKKSNYWWLLLLAIPLLKKKNQ